MVEQALSNLKVLDLTHRVAGPYCTKLMAGFGAEVIKIERPRGGDKQRDVPPFADDEHGRETGLSFMWLNTGKKSVTLDLKHPAGREVATRLTAQSDLVVENFSPRVLPGLGLDYETLRQVNPTLVMTSISNFGQTGPYRDYQADEIILEALGGLMQQTGDPARPPLRSGVAVAQYTAGMAAYVASLIALFRRAHTQTGALVDVSIHEAVLDNIEISLVEYLRLGRVANRTGDQHVLVPWQLFPCKDGHAAIIGGPIRHWLKGACLFEEPRLVQEPYRHIADRMQRRDEVKALLEPWLMRNTKTDIYHQGQRHRLAFGYLASLDEVDASPQLEARQFFTEIDHPLAGPQRYCGPPFRSSDGPWRSVRAPLLGEHTEEILRDRLHYTDQALAALREEHVI